MKRYFINFDVIVSEKKQLNNKWIEDLAQNKAWVETIGKLLERGDSVCIYSGAIPSVKLSSYLKDLGFNEEQVGKIATTMVAGDSQQSLTDLQKILSKETLGKSNNLPIFADNRDDFCKRARKDYLAIYMNESFSPIEKQRKLINPLYNLRPKSGNEKKLHEKFRESIGEISTQKIMTTLTQSNPNTVQAKKSNVDGKAEITAQPSENISRITDVNSTRVCNSKSEEFSCKIDGKQTNARLDRTKENLIISTDSGAIVYANDTREYNMFIEALGKNLIQNRGIEEKKTEAHFSKNSKML